MKEWVGESKCAVVGLLSAESSVSFFSLSCQKLENCLTCSPPCQQKLESFSILPLKDLFVVCFCVCQYRLWLLVRSCMMFCYHSLSFWCWLICLVKTPKMIFKGDWLVNNMTFPFPVYINLHVEWALSVNAELSVICTVLFLSISNLSTIKTLCFNVFIVTHWRPRLSWWWLCCFMRFTWVRECLDWKKKTYWQLRQRSAAKEPVIISLLLFNVCNHAISRTRTGNNSILYTYADLMGFAVTTPSSMMCFYFHAIRPTSATYSHIPALTVSLSTSAVYRELSENGLPCGHHPEEALHCCWITSVVFSSVLVQHMQDTTFFVLRW